MKLQFNQTYIREIRQAPVFRVPKNIVLEILIFGCIFFGAAMMESTAMSVWIMPEMLRWTMEQMDASGTVSSDAVMEYMNDLLLNPTATMVMLYCTIAGTLVIFIYCRFVEGRRLSTLGFYRKGAWKQYGIGLAVGFIMFTAVLGLNLLFGGVKFEGLQNYSIITVLLMLAGYLFQGMSEEVICRGFMMSSTLRHHGIWPAVIINSVFFGLAHLGNSGVNFLAIFNIILYGVFMSLYVLRTGSLWGSCAIHSIWNFVQGNFYGMPVSGIDSGDSIFRFSLNNGMDLVNGGTFGSEAGICTLIVLILSTAVLFAIPLKTGDAVENAPEDPEAVQP